MSLYRGAKGALQAVSHSHPSEHQPFLSDAIKKDSFKRTGSVCSRFHSHSVAFLLFLLHPCLSSFVLLEMIMPKGIAEWNANSKQV